MDFSQIEQNYQKRLETALTRLKNNGDRSPLKTASGISGLSIGALSEIRRNIRRVTIKSIQRLETLFEQIEKSDQAEQTPEALENCVELDDRHFAEISDWYFYAILSLANVSSSRADTKWISQRLGIDEQKARSAFELLRKNKIIQVKDNKFQQIAPMISTKLDVPSWYVQKYHRQNLNLALESLQKTPVKKRDFSAITFAIDPQKLPAAKKIIAQTRAKLNKLFEAGDKQVVYTFAAQLFPIDQKEN